MGGGFRPPMGGGFMPMGGGWHHRLRYNRSGGGCCGIIFLPIIILIMVGSILTSTFRTGSFDYTMVRYDEEKFQDYANEQYAEEFGSSAAYEDNLLLTVLTDDDYYTFYYIAWVGDHVDPQIRDLLGNNQTVLGQLMEQSINQTNYKYSLDSDLAAVVRELTKEIEALGLADSYTCEEDHVQVASGLRNYTSNNASALEMTESTVQEALTVFTETTGIPMVIVVEDGDDVFGVNRSISTSGATPILLIIVGIVFVVALIFGVKAVSNKKKRRDQQDFNSGGNYQRDYGDFDDYYKKGGR